MAILNFENVKPSDSGTYSFTVSNDYGSASTSCVLNVTGNESTLGKAIIVLI